jgi:8-oxo-dGTP pyrophosphatase MutT (NUDIX family)
MQDIHAVGVIFGNQHGEVLVLKRHPQDPEGNSWGLVGGKIEKGENAIAAAQRETQEEIGQIIDTTRFNLLKTYTWPRDDASIHFVTFECIVETPKFQIALDREEHISHMWETPAKLYQRNDLMTGLYPILKDKYDLY